MEYTRKLASFCSNLTLEMLAPEVIHKAKLCILDYVANIYGSLELETVQGIVAYIRSLASAQTVTVLGCGFKSDPHHAAFVNGTTAEAIEAQDGLRFGGNHPGAAVIPAALAAAEVNDSNGGEVIEAVVAGYEAANRPAAAMHPWHTLGGFLPTGTCGTFGAAVAAAKLYRYNSDKLLNAVSNAGYLLPLSMAEQLMGGYTIKIVQGGQAASAGIMATGLAGAGVTGAPYILEGSELNGGFAKITSATEPVLDRITDGLGEHYSIMDIYFKPYTACRHTHGAAQAALELINAGRFDLDDVEQITVSTYGIAELAVGKGVDETSTFVSAQFSIPYVVAACLMDRELGPAQLTEQRMQDKQLLKLAGKVTVKTDGELNEMYPEKTSSRVELVLKGGDILTRQIDNPKGDPREPLGADDLAMKTRSFAGNRDLHQVNRLIDLILNLENVTDIRGLCGLV